MTSRAGRHPMSRHPLVAIADPTPIAADPDPARRRRRADDFHLRRRRCDHDDSSGEMALIRNDHAAAKTAEQHA